MQQVSDKLTWTAQDEVWLRGIASLPELDEETIEEERERKKGPPSWRRTAARTAILPAVPPFCCSRIPTLQPGRRGRVRPEELERLHLTERLDPQKVMTQWLGALDSADAFVRRRPPEEAGFLYYSPERGTFVDPDRAEVTDVVPHYTRPGGVLPRIVNEGRPVP